MEEEYNPENQSLVWAGATDRKVVRENGQKVQMSSTRNPKTRKQVTQ